VGRQLERDNDVLGLQRHRHSIFANRESCELRDKWQVIAAVNVRDLAEAHQQSTAQNIGRTLSR
jgi:hypothetical protein